MRIAIVGSGGVGGYFGGRLAQGGADVTFIARGAHLEALQRNGLRINSPLGDLHLPKVSATDDTTTVGPVDLVFFSVKQYDTDAALALVPPLVGPDTVAIAFQNGVESVDKLKATVGAEHVAGGTSYISAVIDSPGVIRHTTSDRLIFGELDGTKSARLERLHQACLAAGIHPLFTDQINVEIWTKFAHLTVFSAMTSAVRLPVGPIREDPDLVAMWQAALLESMAVARARGIALAPGFMDTTMKLVMSWPPQMKASMFEDLERGRRLELPWLSGAIVRLGREVGVETPIHRFLVTILTPHVNGRRPA
jgi:2-dehydropantoate 2-reductase